MSEDTDSIYLSVDELERIYNHDFSDNKKLDKVRDLFIIACWTGLRFSDMCELSIDNISKTPYGQLITIKTVKTGETVVIPVHNTIIEILKKYKNILPRVPSNQKMNDYLKDIGEAVKIKETVELVKTKGGLRFKEAFQKWELISSHTARRSFATNMYIADIPAISIMKITGHKTEKSFLRYIKISPEDNAKKMLQHPLFRKTNLKIAN
jgi:integrase